MEIARPVHHISFDGCSRVAFKGWSCSDVRHAALPLAVDQSRGDVDAVERNHAVLRMNIRRWKSQLHASLGPAHDAAFNTIWPAQHATRKIHAAF